GKAGAVASRARPAASDGRAHRFPDRREPGSAPAAPRPRGRRRPEAPPTGADPRRPGPCPQAGPDRERGPAGGRSGIHRRGDSHAAAAPRARRREHGLPGGRGMSTTAQEVGSSARPDVHPHRRVWPWLLGLGLLLLALVGARSLAARRTAAEAAARGREARPVPAVTAPARTGDIPVYLRGLGPVTAFNTAPGKGRGGGQLLSVPVKEGQTVREGELLAQIDPRSFDVQLQQAEGQLAKDKAARKDAQVILERDQALLDEQIIPQQQLDSQRAQVDESDGAIKADEAQVGNARLQLSYSRITAPFSGRVGLRQVDIGNIVHASDPGGLLVLTQVKPIAVVFSLPQDNLHLVVEKLKTTAALPVLAFDRDNSKQIAEGKLLSLDDRKSTRPRSSHT